MTALPCAESFFHATIDFGHYFSSHADHYLENLIYRKRNTLFYRQLLFFLLMKSYKAIKRKTVRLKNPSVS